MKSPALLAFTTLIGLTGASCIVPDGAQPRASLSVDAATKFVHRGMVQNENGVIQPSAIIQLPAKRDGQIVARVWANSDLTNDTGDAWLPDGHAGKFSQIDFNLLYVQQLEDFTITSGFISYMLPNGLEFPFGERGETSEFMVEAVYTPPRDTLPVKPFAAVHYDFDEVEGFYLRGGANHQLAFGDEEETQLTTILSIGWMDQSMAFWNYADPDNQGLADASLRTTLTHKLGPHTTLNGFVAYSTIVDGGLREWFDTIAIDPDQLYAGVGVSWTY